MGRYLAGMMDPFVSPFELNKLMYFVQEAGEPLGLRLSKGPYGPFAENLGDLLSGIEGHYVTGYGAGGDRPDKILELVPGAVEAARSALDSRPATRSRFDKVSKLVDGFESPFGLELLATVHWVMSREAARSIQEVIEATYAWNERKRRFSPDQITLASRRLRDLGWLAA